VSIGPNGALYVIDGQSDEIRVFDGSGRFLRRFGGRGEGPGELDGAVSMGWDGLDRLWVPDAFNGRYTVFDSLGGLVKTVSSGGRRGVSELLYPTYFDRRGSFVDHTANAAGVTFIRRDTTGRIVDTLAFLQRPHVSTGPHFGLSDEARDALRRFTPRLVWTLGPDGTLWQGRTDSLRLTQRTLEGNTLRIVETQHRESSFSAAEQELVDRALRETDGDAVLAPAVLQEIYVLPDGHVLAQIPDEMNVPGEVMDVFDPQGRFLGSMRWPFAPHPRSLPAFKGDTVIAVTLGELDVPYVVRATLKRPRR
jgi:hypothetical protein